MKTLSFIGCAVTLSIILHAAVSSAGTNVQLTPDDVRFLTSQCQIDRTDIDVIAQLTKKEVQENLYSKIVKKDCALLVDFKASRMYCGQLKTVKKGDRAPKPPSGWNVDYLTSGELSHFADIVENEPW